LDFGLSAAGDAFFNIYICIYGNGNFYTNKLSERIIIFLIRYGDRVIIRVLTAVIVVTTFIIAMKLVMPTAIIIPTFSITASAIIVILVTTERTRFYTRIQTGYFWGSMPYIRYNANLGLHFY